MLKKFLLPQCKANDTKPKIFCVEKQHLVKQTQNHVYPLIKTTKMQAVVTL